MGYFKNHDIVASNLLLVGELAACTNTIVSVNLVEHVDLDNLEFCFRNYSPACDQESR